MHGKHSVLPEVEMYLPAGHRSHVSLPALAENVPGRHLVCSVEPVVAKEPGSARQVPAVCEDESEAPTALQNSFYGNRGTTDVTTIMKA